MVELQAVPQILLLLPMLFFFFNHKNKFSRDNKKDQRKQSKFQPTQVLTSTGSRTIRVARVCVGICISTPVYKWNLGECIQGLVTV